MATLMQSYFKVWLLAKLVDFCIFPRLLQRWRFYTVDKSKNVSSFEIDLIREKLDSMLP